MNFKLIKNLALCGILSSGCTMRQPVVHHEEQINPKTQEKETITYSQYEKEYTFLGHTCNAILFSAGEGIDGFYEGFKESTTNSLFSALWVCPMSGIGGFGSGLWNGLNDGYDISYKEKCFLDREQELQRSIYFKHQIEKMKKIWEYE